jgi:hypothetical protein
MSYPVRTDRTDPSNIVDRLPNPTSATPPPGRDLSDELLARGEAELLLCKLNRFKRVRKSSGSLWNDEGEAEL